jgi:hypothetical protein
LEIAGSVVAVLSPYLAQAGGALAARAGEGVATLIKDLYGLVRRKFDEEREGDGRAALRDLEEEPADTSKQKALERALAERANADQAFANELASALEKITRGAPVNQQFLTQVYGGEVGKIVNIGQADTVNI